MKEVQLLMNLVTGMIVLTAIGATVNFGVEDDQTLEKLLAKKQAIISCGYSKTIENQNVVYSKNNSVQVYEQCLNTTYMPSSDHSKDSGEGNGCSHQLSVGALLVGGYNRKQHNACTGS